ncbi:hypothetical protein F4777DRAFT_588729 [Nemania sp. FL0916]|nr:hypothetical protein F4777DRAFT_588729 [Nemania sp. FL0916]
MDKTGVTHWLARYGNGYHAWRRQGSDAFSRPCGIMEFRFDADGRYFGGRADVNALLNTSVSTRLSAPRLQHHLLLAYTLLRLRHCLLRASVELRTLEVEPWFSVRIPASADAAIRDAGKAVQFLDPDVDGVLDMADFYVHAQNVARVLDPSEVLSRLFVLPRKPEGSSRRKVQFLFVMAHQIVDGLSCMYWMADFTRIVNMPTEDIRLAIEAAVSPDSVRASLPPAQEDLYAPVAPTRAQQRWFWAITIVLKHVKKPLPEAFPNPLRRTIPLSKSRPLPPKYASALDYSQTPPLNTFFVRFQLSKAASQRLYRLCRGVNASIGAGGFVLVGMAMMAIHEARYPNDTARRPFVGHFPLNARSYFNSNLFENVMLAFSKGIVLPFLPSHLDLEARFRLLARTASRQLGAYRKRDCLRDLGDAIAYNSINGVGRLLASNYIDGLERLRNTLPEHLRSAIPPPQGAYTAPSWAVSRATCGVSSVGRVDWSVSSRPDVNTADPGTDGVFAAAESLHSGVRVRDTEFLVGTWSQDDVLTAVVSFDGNYIDELNVHAWVEVMKSLLEVRGEDDGVESQALKVSLSEEK